jgi:hypothetical protein
MERLRSHYSHRAKHKTGRSLIHEPHPPPLGPAAASFPRDSRAQAAAPWFARKPRISASRVQQLLVAARGSRAAANRLLADRFGRFRRRDK